MAFPTIYVDWLALVRDFIGSDEYSDAQIGVFLDLAQTRLNREMSSYYMEEVKDIVVTQSMVDAGSIFYISYFVPDFNKIRLVSILGVGSLTAAAINELVNYRAVESSDPSKFYAIDAQQIHFYPGLSLSQTIRIRYYMQIPLISPILDENVFTVHYPDAFLYACCLEAAPYQVEDDRIPVWENKYATALAVANNVSDRIKMGSTPIKREITSLS